MKPLLLLEFNELCPSLLERFMADGLLPSFKALHDSSAVYRTDAGESPPNLEPWIQWPTVHYGVPFAEHGAFHLGDGRKIPQKGVAQILSEAGVRVGVFCSMNTNYSDLNGYYVPDPWSADGEVSPGWLGPFYRTVASQVQESSRESNFSAADMARFGAFMVRNGLSPATAKSVAAQLLAERLRPGRRWRRAVLLDSLQYDVFRSLNRRLGVEFATLFLNSTAHFQHYYWRNMEPGEFAVPPSPDEDASLKEAIRFGYRAMDRIVGRVLRDYPDAVIVFCTALSQQPWKDTTKCTYRPADFGGLLEFAGIDPGSARVKPVMSEEFHLEFENQARATAAADNLRALTIDGTPLMRVEPKGTSLFAGCAVFEHCPGDRTVRSGSGRTARFDRLFHLVHSMRSGRHHPEGALWIRGGRRQASTTAVPLIDIAPTVLGHFGVRAPSYMRGRALAMGV